MRELRDNSDRAVHLYEVAALLVKTSSSPITKTFAQDVKEYLETDKEESHNELMLGTLYRVSSTSIRPNTVN